MCIILTFTIISIKQCLKQYLVIFSKIVCTHSVNILLIVLHECMTASCITACAVPNFCAVCAYLHQSYKNAYMQTAKGLKYAREKSLAQHKLSSLVHSGGKFPSWSRGGHLGFSDSDGVDTVRLLSSEFDKMRSSSSINH